MEAVTNDALTHEELIDSRIELHDSNQFEVKLDYTIRPDRRDNRYRIEAYFFVPRSLGIDAYNYPRDQFYSDVQAYIRFKTPSVSLRSLLEPDNPHSPFNAIAVALGRAMRSGRDVAAHKVLSHELRLLGCLVRANLRDRSIAIAADVKGLRGHEDERPTIVEGIRMSTSALLGELEGVVGRFRALRTAFSDPVVPAWLREVYQYVDEFLSLSVESYLTMLIDEIDHGKAMRGVLLCERKALTAVVVGERAHRQGAGYKTVLKQAGAQENFVYRSGLLKKYVSSVLFLEISKEAEGRSVREAGAAIAAGTAMLFAATVGIAIQARWGLNSIPFLIALVASYILKDRIKEWMRQYFTRKMTRVLADYDVRIRDPETDVVLGRCREAFSFLKQKRVPREVLERRHVDAVSLIEADSKPEVVMKYEKDIHLDGKVIGRAYGRMTDINDIIRFNVAHFLMRTDDPTRVVRYYDADHDAVETVRCPKVYHINVVFVLRARDKAQMERVRVVFDKRGIRRIESV